MTNATRKALQLLPTARTARQLTLYFAMIMASCALARSAGTTTTGSQSPKPPNIILFYVDDMGYKDIGCYGSTFYETPNIDKLAASGMRFTNAYAACPVCSPSRAALMTGKYPARMGTTDHLALPARKPHQKSGSRRAR